MEGESKAEETKRIAACRFAVANNRNAAIDGEPSSTSHRVRAIEYEYEYRTLARPEYEYDGILFRDGQNYRITRARSLVRFVG